MSDAMPDFEFPPEVVHRVVDDRDQFLRSLLRELVGVISEYAGPHEAAGFVKLVGLQLGRQIGRDYEGSLGDQTWSLETLANVLVDLKRRIQGGFSIESIGENGIVLVNDRCPFGEMVRGRPALCQMTSSVFGSITAQHFDYANVVIDEAIARGDARCRVRVRVDLSQRDGCGDDFFPDVG